MSHALQIWWSTFILQLNRSDCSLTARKRSLFTLIGVSFAVTLCLQVIHQVNHSKVKVNQSNQSKSNCTGYFELRQVKFLDDTVRSKLCDGITAYTIVQGKFPLCQLSSQLPVEIEHEVNSEALQGYIISKVTGRNVTIMGYHGSDSITREITNYHAWEPQLVTGLIRIMMLLPKGEVTFLDVGSNIGVYSLQAADAGFPTVAVDANIRNLLRMRLAARSMSWAGDRIKLFWAFFHTHVSIRYLEFNTGFCNIGGAGGSINEDSAYMADTVPVMTAVANDLLPHLNTRLIVMKIDIETSERVFFETGARLLDEKQIVAVQMEWWRLNNLNRATSSPNHRFLVDFFQSRNYVLLSPITLERLDPETFREWDTLWVRQDFVNTVRQSVKL